MNHHAFIADTHLGHKRILEYDNRPFSTIEEHDEAITKACAASGTPGGTLWLLGDVATYKHNLEAFLASVKPRWGRVVLIRGNHDDKVAWKMREMFDEAHESRYLRVTPEVRLYLSHYAHRVWRNSHHGSFHLHGHSHGALPPWGRSMDVGANCIGYKPITLDEVVAALSDKPTIWHH